MTQRLLPSASTASSSRRSRHAARAECLTEAGPRHCTAGLRVKPERAAAGTFSAAASIASTAATAIEAARSVTHLPCRAVCVRHVTVCDRQAGPLCVRWDQNVWGNRDLSSSKLKKIRPAGASQRGELGLQTRKNRPIAEFLQPAERLRRCSGSKKSVIYKYTRFKRNYYTR